MLPSIQSKRLNKLTEETRKQSTYDIYHSDCSENIEYKELKNNIDEAIESLPEKCKTIFKLNRFEGLKYREIAEKLGVTFKAVEFHMRKALHLLRKNLQEYLPLLTGILFFGLQKVFLSNQKFY